MKKVKNHFVYENMGCNIIPFPKVYMEEEKKKSFQILFAIGKHLRFKIPSLFEWFLKICEHNSCNGDVL